MSAVTAPLTARQREVLAAFTELTNRTGIPPTVRELGVALGLASTNTVQGHLFTLVRKGYLTHSPRSSHAFRALSRQARMVATGGVWVVTLGGFGEHEIHLFGSELAVGRWLMDLCVEVADYGVLGGGGAEHWTWACETYGQMPLPDGTVAEWEWRTVEDEGVVDDLR